MNNLLTILISSHNSIQLILKNMNNMSSITFILDQYTKDFISNCCAEYMRVIFFGRNIQTIKKRKDKIDCCDKQFIFLINCLSCHG